MATFSADVATFCVAPVSVSYILWHRYIFGYEGPQKSSHLQKVATFCGTPVLATFCGVPPFRPVLPWPFEIKTKIISAQSCRIMCESLVRNSISDKESQR